MRVHACACMHACACTLRTCSRHMCSRSSSAAPLRPARAASARCSSAGVGGGGPPRARSRSGRKVAANSATTTAAACSSAHRPARHTGRRYSGAPSLTTLALPAGDARAAAPRPPRPLRPPRPPRSPRPPRPRPFLRPLASLVAGPPPPVPLPKPSPSPSPCTPSSISSAPRAFFSAGSAWYTIRASCFLSDCRMASLVDVAEARLGRDSEAGAAGRARASADGVWPSSTVWLSAGWASSCRLVAARASPGEGVTRAGVAVVEASGDADTCGASQAVLTAWAGAAVSTGGAASCSVPLFASFMSSRPTDTPPTSE